MSQGDRASKGQIKSQGHNPNERLRKKEYDESCDRKNSLTVAGRETLKMMMEVKWLKNKGIMIGKFVIGYYIGSSSIGSAYGAAGSIIIILVWVYYSAIILYFGAEFTKVFASRYGKAIIPNDYAVEIKKQIFETKPS